MATTIVDTRRVRKVLTLFTLEFVDANGKLRRRHCGPDCYNDRDERHGGTATRSCHCICLGVNHGIGRAAAIAESKREVEYLIAYYKPVRHWICDEVRRMDLFEPNETEDR